MSEPPKGELRGGDESRGVAEMHDEDAPWPVRLAIRDARIAELESALATARAEREALRGVAGVFGFRIIAENAVMRPACMSYVKPSELAGCVARRITELESQLAALAPTEPTP